MKSCVTVHVFLDANGLSLHIDVLFVPKKREKKKKKRQIKNYETKKYAHCLIERDHVDLTPKYTTWVLGWDVAHVNAMLGMFDLPQCLRNI